MNTLIERFTKQPKDELAPCTTTSEVADPKKIPPDNKDNSKVSRATL